MDAPNWRQIVGGSVGVVLLGAIGYFGQARIRTGSPPQQIKASKPSSFAKSKTPVGDMPSAEQPAPPSMKIKVDISGEIANPGVYEVLDGDRVEQLVKLAGGIKPTADRDSVNFAQKLHDETKIVVRPKKVEKTKVQSTKSSGRSTKPSKSKEDINDKIAESRPWEDPPSRKKGGASREPWNPPAQPKYSDHLLDDKSTSLGDREGSNRRLSH